MRNLKKVLTLVLTLAMLLSVMVVGAGAATFGDQESITNKEAVDVCTTLNIIGGYEDGTFRPAGNVTRAEMCKMICVALNGGKEPTMGSGLIGTFNDVAKDNWAAPYIEYCVSQGIVGGVGGGRFDPTGNITGTQAAKMLLCILGYNASIQGYVGNDFWETKINVDAAQKGLYTGLANIDASAPLTRDSAAQMIWNALNAYEVEYVTTLVPGPDGTLTSQVDVRDKVVGETKDKITLLEDKYEAETAIGTFTGNHDMSSSIKDGNIRIENAKINGSGNGIYQFKYDLDLKYLGEEVKVLYRDGRDGLDGRLDDKDTIYGVFVTGATTVYNIIRDDIQKVTTDKIKFDDVEHEYDNNGSINYNYGSATERMLQGNLMKLMIASGDTVKLIENANGKIDSIYVVQSNITKVSAVNATKVSLDTVGAIDIEGNDIYNGIAKDDVVVYTQLYNSNKDDAKFIVTKAETVSGTMKSFKDLEKVTLDSTTYFVDKTELVDAGSKLPNLTTDAIRTFDNAHLEKAATLYLINGFVGAADSQATETNYALVTAVDNMSNVENVINGAKVQLLTLDGKTVYAVDEDTVDNFPNAADVASNVTVGKLVEFALTSDNTVEIKSVVSSLYTVTPTTDGGGNTVPAVVYDKDAKALTISATATSIADTDAVFFTSTNGAGEDYKAYKMRSLGDITVTVNTDVYYVLNSEGTKVVAAFADLGSKPSGAASDTMYGMVISVERNVKVDGVNYNKYIVWTGDNTEVFVKGGTFEKGDFVYFDKTTDNLYASSEVTKLTGSGVSAFIRVVEYESEDKVLTYYDNVNDKNVPVAVDSDVVIVYVDRANKTAGETVGVNRYDEVNDYTNALYVDIDGDHKIDAIIVDENRDIEDKGNTSAKSDLDDAISSVTAPVLNGIETALGDGSVQVNGSTVTITGASDDVDNNVLNNSGLFNALRDIPNFKEATFKVNGTAVSGKLTANNHDADNATLWGDLQAKLTAAKSSKKITEEVTVKTNKTQTSFTVVINIADDDN